MGLTEGKMKSIKLFPVALAVVLTSGCTDVEEKPASENPKEAQREDAFSKKIQCANFLAKVEHSIIGPRGRNEPGVSLLAPVAFYSRKLNTCVLVTTYMYKRGEHFERAVASVDDMLTGTNIESRLFDMKTETESKELLEFDTAMMRKYEAP